MEKLNVLKRGAESIIYEGYFLGYHVVFKERLSKHYRNPIVDRSINSQRTMMEAHFIYNALKAGVNSPAVLFVDKENFTLVLEYIKGKSIKEILESSKIDYEFLREMGRFIGLLHSRGISHGDVNTNNFMVSDQGELFLIDFGLSKRTDDIEDFGTDIEVFYRSLDTVHPEARDELLVHFIEGYSKVMGKERTQSVFKTAQEIRSRGRYVSKDERKKYVFDYEDD